MAELVDSEELKGGAGESVAVRLNGSLRRVAVVGVGEKLSDETASGFGAAVMKLAKVFIVLKTQMGILGHGESRECFWN